MSSSIKDVSGIVAGDLIRCDAEQLVAFQRYKVEPYYAPIVRYGSIDSVVVVARRDSEVIYWEDVEEGFNVSPLGQDGTILQHWCNQDDLGLALNSWIDGRGPHVQLVACRTDPMIRAPVAPLKVLYSFHA